MLAVNYDVFDDELNGAYAELQHECAKAVRDKLVVAVEDIDPVLKLMTAILTRGVEQERSSTITDELLNELLSEAIAKPLTLQDALLTLAYAMNDLIVMFLGNRDNFMASADNTATVFCPEVRKHLGKVANDTGIFDTVSSFMLPGTLMMSFISDIFAQEECDKRFLEKYKDKYDKLLAEATGRLEENNGTSIQPEQPEQ